MILVDTNVWIDFFKGESSVYFLRHLIKKGEVFLHPLVLGELLVGNLGGERQKALVSLLSFPSLPYEFDFAQTADFINAHKLNAQGLSIIDIELLRSCIDLKNFLWTQDKILSNFASKMKLEFRPQSS